MINSNRSGSEHRIRVRGTGAANPIAAGHFEREVPPDAAATRVDGATEKEGGSISLTMHVFGCTALQSLGEVGTLEGGHWRRSKAVAA